MFDSAFSTHFRTEACTERKLFLPLDSSAHVDYILSIHSHSHSHPHLVRLYQYNSLKWLNWIWHRNGWTNFLPWQRHAQNCVTRMFETIFAAMHVLCLHYKLSINQCGAVSDQTCYFSIFNKLIRCRIDLRTVYFFRVLHGCEKLSIFVAKHVLCYHSPKTSLLHFVCMEFRRNMVRLCQLVNSIEFVGASPECSWIKLRSDPCGKTGCIPSD